MHRLIIISLTLILNLVGCTPTPSPLGDEPIEVLFIGNSYTFMHDMPVIFAELAESGGYRVDVTVLAKAGYSLADHAQDPETSETFKEQDWDIVILQEKSTLPVLDKELMVDGVRQLHEHSEAQGSETILFLPWAYQDGFPEAGLSNYQEMQSKVAEAYLTLARDFDISVVPVGIAWQSALAGDPGLELWSLDGSHPSLLGAHLAANTFYAALFNESPAGLPAPEGLSIDSDTITILREFAADTILENPGRWKP